MVEIELKVRGQARVRTINKVRLCIINNVTWSYVHTHMNILMQSDVVPDVVYVHMYTCVCVYCCVFVRAR